MSTYIETRAAALERFPNAEENAYRLDCIAALLGANEEWDSAADYLEYIAHEVHEARAAGIPKFGVNEPENLEFWRRIADAYSIEHDGDDEDEDENA